MCVVEFRSVGSCPSVGNMLFTVARTQVIRLGELVEHRTLTNRQEQDAKFDPIYVLIRHILCTLLYFAFVLKLLLADG